MGGQLAGRYVRDHPAEIDDPRDSGMLGAAGEGCGHRPLLLLEAMTGRQRMHQVVGAVHTRHGLAHRVGVGGVAGEDLDPVGPRSF